MSSHHVQYISQAQNERWSEKFCNSWHRESGRLIAALRLSVAQRGSWKSSAPGEASAELLLVKDHCAPLWHFGYWAVQYHFPSASPVQKWAGVGTGWDGGWILPICPEPIEKCWVCPAAHCLHSQRPCSRHGRTLAEKQNILFLCLFLSTPPPKSVCISGWKTSGIALRVISQQMGVGGKQNSKS